MRIILRMCLPIITATATVILAYVTWNLANFTRELVESTKELKTIDEHRSGEELLSARHELLFRLATVIGDVPNNRQCMLYLLAIDKSKGTQRPQQSNPIRQIMSGDSPIRLLKNTKLLAEKRGACLGGLLLRTEKHAEGEDAERSYIRSQIKRLTNIMDLAAQRLLAVPKKELEDYMTNQSNPVYQLASNLYHLHDRTNEEFISKWGGDRFSIQSFAICRIFSCGNNAGILDAFFRSQPRCEDLA